jgi:hypothetical protein
VSAIEESKEQLLKWVKDATRSVAELSDACGRFPEVDRAIASHPSASGELLAKLSHSKDKATRARVTANPATPPADLVRLGQQFPKEFLKNPALDLLMLENPALLREAPASLLVRLLKSDSCPAEFLAWASAHPEEQVQLAVAMNAAAPAQAIEVLGKSAHAKVRESVSTPLAFDCDDMELQFEKAVIERLQSLDRYELEEAWLLGDIGLSQWHVLPLEYRLHRVAGGFWFTEGESVARLLSQLGWSPTDVKARLPRFSSWKHVARSNSTNAHTLELLATDTTPEIRKEVAANKSASSSLLEALSRDVDSTVRSSVAYNHSSSVNVLDALARDKHVDVRAFVAGNPNSSPQALELLSQDRKSAVRLEVALNISTTPLILEKLARDSDSAVRQMAARNPLTSTVALDALASDKAKQVRLEVASNRSASLLALSVLSTERDASIRSAVARNPSCPPAVLKKLARDSYPGVLEAVAKNSHAHADSLEILFASGNRSVWWELARNPATPLSVLEDLSKQDEPWIQVWLAHRLSLGEERAQQLLEFLSKSPSENDRKGVAMHSRASSALLQVLCRDKKMSVRLGVAGNPHCPSEVLARMASDVKAVQEEVAKNPNTPVEVLIQLAASKDVSVRKNLAQQAFRSFELSRHLAGDPEDEVRQGLASCSQLSDEMLEQLRKDFQLEGDLMVLFLHPRLSLPAMQDIAGRLFDTPAEQSPWFVKQLEKASEEIRAATKARNVLTYFGSNPTKAVLSRRPMAAIMALCSGPYVDPKSLAQVTRSTDWLVRASVARNPGTPPNMLKQLGGDAHPLVRGLAHLSLRSLNNMEVKVASQGPASTPLNLDRIVTEILERMRADGCGWSVTPLVSSPAWRGVVNLGEVLGWLKRFEEFDDYVCQLLADIDEDRRSLFWQWATSAKDDELRMRLASHPKTPTDAVERFASDDCVAVLIAVASRGDIPMAMRLKMEKNALKGIMRRGVAFRVQMAIHASHITAVRERLSRDERRVRYALNATAGFPDWLTAGRLPEKKETSNLKPEWLHLAHQSLERQFHSDIVDTAVSAMKGPDVLNALVWLGVVSASDKIVPTTASRRTDWLARLGAALHPGATDAVLRLLQDDIDLDVSAAAKLALSLRRPPH